MAKKRHKSPRSNPAKQTVAEDASQGEVAVIDNAAERYVGQWNRLVSTTNWEKGRIICQWREALMTSGAAVTEYSDEVWAQLVGNVTSQHVGRLRRVFQRFGEVHEQYEGLYWSHFQAALDWDDAEMWLEGAIHNDWSVSQMRGKRWETLGTPPEQQQAEIEADQFSDEPTPPSTSASEDGSVAPEIAPAQPKASTVKPLADDESTTEEKRSRGAKGPSSTSSSAVTPKQALSKIDVEQLPDDLAEAFESFKLAIIAQRREGWKEITPDGVVKCLDALRQLTLAKD